jgi:tetratricopeptide (TPR) repeat protein
LDSEESGMQPRPRTRGPGVSPEQAERIRRLLQTFATNPTDARAFKTLEEHLYLEGAWTELASVYDCRLSVLAPTSAERAEVLARAASIYNERLGDVAQARARYEDLLRMQPQNVAALTSLRRMLAAAGDATSALQLAEAEEALTQAPKERAQLLAEIGQLWRGLGDKEEARRRFDAALELDPKCDPAVQGAALLAEDAGDRARALALHESRLPGLAGNVRADVLERMARLVPAEDVERRSALLREVVQSHPQRRGPVERLIEIERNARNYARVDELQRALWKLVHDPVERIALAAGAAALQIDEAENVESAAYWAERAGEIASDDAAVQKLRLRIHRRAGATRATLDALEKLAAIEGASTMRLLELAVGYEREGLSARAVETLERLLAHDPYDGEALAILDRCLARMGRHAERSEVLERRMAAAESNEEASDLMVELGDLHLHALGDGANAEAAYRRALEQVPAHAAAAAQLRELLRSTGRGAELCQLIEGLAHSAPPGRGRAALLCELAQLRLEHGRPASEAHAAYSEALECDPGCASALAGMRELAATTREPKALLEVSERELALEPPPERAAVLLGDIAQAAQALGDSARARSAAQRWLELEPSPGALGLLAELARTDGDFASERRWLESLEALVQGTQPVAHALACVRLAELALADTGAAAAAEVERWYRAARASAPEDEALGARLIEFYRRTNKLPELARELRTQLEARGAAAPLELALELARTLAELGDLVQASSVLQPAFERDPESTAAGDLLESLLAEQNRIEELCEVLGQRLSRERDPGRRRELAHRQAGLLLEGLQRAADAIAVLREFADPTRDGRLEHLFARALEAGGETRELETWLEMRESHVSGAERTELLLRLAALLERDGRIPDAIACLKRAREGATAALAATARGALLALLRNHGSLEDQRAFLDESIESAPDAAARAQLLVERARLFAERLRDPARALADLERAQADGMLGPDELRLVAELCAAAGAPERQIHALEALSETVPEPAQRRITRLELARLFVDGPEAVRDPARGEEVLRALLRENGADADAFDRLSLLLERAERGPELRRLFGERLAEPALRPGERPSLALRLARLQVAAGDARMAVETLVGARAQDNSDPALDELLFSALARAGNASGQIQLCTERAQAAEGADRARWLRRWLAALESARRPAAERLQVIDRLLADGADDAELLALRLPLLREAAEPEKLADGLERLLRHAGAGSLASRRLWVRELLALYEGPLARPERALELCERELANDAGLRDHGLRAARALGDERRELALLRPLAAQDALPPAELRRLGLALARAGEGDEAYTVLCRARAHAPLDREVLAALEALVRESGDDGELLGLLAARFSTEAGEEKLRAAREAVAAAARSHDAPAELGWLRKLHALEPLDRDRSARWLALERQTGTPGGRLEAVRAVGGHARDAAERRELGAAEGEILVELGQLAEASACYARALAGEPRAKLAWLRAQSELLARLGRPSERVDLLRTLSRHPDASSEERMRTQRERIELLAAHPELREEAALELRMWLDSDPNAPRATQLERMRSLLALYAELGRDADWCALAERALPLAPDAERADLERRIAERLGSALGSTDQAISAWQRVLARSASDRDALAALASLLRRPGDEAQRADALERLGATGVEHAEQLWLDAARLRWQALGDANAALADVERALSLSSRLDGAHDLRSELCAHLDRHDDEATSLRALLADDADGPLAADRWLRLAQLVAAQREGWSEAIDAAERALRAARGQGTVVREARRVFERAHAFERARDLLAEEISAASGDEALGLHRRLARIAWDELQDEELACKSLAALAASDALRTDDRERYAAALAEQGRWRESLEQRQAALADVGDLATAERWLELARDFLQRLDDPARARDAAGRALASQPKNREALSLRTSLHARLNDPAREFEDVLALAELETDAAQAAALFTRAGELARHRLGDPLRAWALFRTALKRDGAHLAALLGAGQIALERGENAEAERSFGLATSLLRGSPDEEKLGDVARSAAQAAIAQERFAEAFRYLELALEREPSHPDALDRMAGLALRLGAHARARDCLETRLRGLELAPDERADRLVKLAQACEGLGQLDRAAAALEEVLSIRPADEVSRARAVDLLERLGETERAVLQLDAWSEHVPSEFAARLALRAAQLELAHGDRAHARERLEAIVDAPNAPDDAWVALLDLVRTDDGAAAGLDLAGAALAAVKAPKPRAALLWTAAEASASLGQNGPAARRAMEVLTCDPSHVPAARTLAANLGHLEDWGQAVKLLERTLDTAHPERPVEAELWEAVGRAYAGPLEDIERSQRSYRRALECNPLRQSAREALADMTAFDPAAHRESVEAHRGLLERHPGRRSSWRALERIATHWKRERAQKTCVAVLQALGPAGGASPLDGPLLVDVSAPADSTVAAATELVLALSEAGALPAAADPRPYPTFAAALEDELRELVGPSWLLSDASLHGVWSQADGDATPAGEDLGFRAKRRLKRALRSFDTEMLRVLGPELWREQVLGQAAARVLAAGRMELRDLLLELLAGWPTTARLELRASGDLASAVQLCPPARVLLLRVAGAVIGTLGL